MEHQVVVWELLLLWGAGHTGLVHVRMIIVLVFPHFEISN